MKALISNIQRFSTKDGPGIRTTVFFKGCPLRCLWCHNPETQSFKRELMYSAENCVLCGRCAAACPRGAAKITENSVVTDRSACTSCGRCAEVCYYNAREVCGKSCTSEEVFEVIERDRAFYSESGGGATFSGGECMSQIDFLTAVLRLCKSSGIRAAIDTSGCAPWSDFEKILPYSDLFLYDVKAADSSLHERLVGVPNDLILGNLKRLSDAGADILLRLPLISGMNASEEDVTKIAELTKDLKIKGVNLLPYHDMGKYKYTKLSRGYNGDIMSTPSDDELSRFKEIFESRGFQSVKIGG